MDRLLIFIIHNPTRDVFSSELIARIASKFNLVSTPMQVGNVIGCKRQNFDIEAIGVVTFKVEGMVCHSCERRIEENLTVDKEAVVFVKADHKLSTVLVIYSKLKVNSVQLAEMIDDMGFDVGHSENTTISMQPKSEKNDLPYKSSFMSQSLVVHPGDKSTTVDTVLDISLPEVRFRRQRAGSKSPGTKSKSQIISHDINGVATEISGDWQTAHFQISGMTCSSCVARIEREVIKLSGVKKVAVALMAEKAEVQYDPSEILSSQISALINELGYRSTEIEVANDNEETLCLDITGMTCSSCVTRVEQVVNNLKGIKNVAVSLIRNSATVVYYPDVIGPRSIIEAIQNMGYTAEPSKGDTEENSNKAHKKVVREWRKSFLISLIFGIPSMIIMMYSMFNCHGSHSDTAKAGSDNNYSLHGNMSQHESRHVPSSFCSTYILPGLSLENLLLFFLCLPIQVVNFKMLPSITIIVL